MSASHVATALRPRRLHDHTPIGREVQRGARLRTATCKQRGFVGEGLDLLVANSLQPTLRSELLDAPCTAGGDGVSLRPREVGISLGSSPMGRVLPGHRFGRSHPGSGMTPAIVATVYPAFLDSGAEAASRRRSRTCARRAMRSRTRASETHPYPDPRPGRHAFPPSGARSGLRIRRRLRRRPVVGDPGRSRPLQSKTAPQMPP